MTSPHLFSEPAQHAVVNPRAGQVWILPSVTVDQRRRVAVVDFAGTMQQVTYFGGRAFTHEGAVPESVRDDIVRACKFVRDEWLALNEPPAPAVTQFYDSGDMVHVVMIDARTPVRLSVNGQPIEVPNP